MARPDYAFLANFDIINTKTGLDDVLISGGDFEHVGKRGYVETNHQERRRA